MTKINGIYSFSEIGDRDNNEDTISPSPPDITNRWFTVCDGMGGHGHGEVASSIVADSVDCYFRSLNKEITREDIQSALDFSIEKLNEKDKYGAEERKMGTTLVLAVLTENNILVAHVGDSRLYHIRKNKGIIFRTKDHSRIQEWIDAEIISVEEAKVHAQKNVITRCIQPYPDKPVIADIEELNDLKTGDYIFLCTDGVTDALSDIQIAGIFNSELPDEEKVDKIIEICRADSNDNFSGIILKITNDSSFKTSERSDNKIKCLECGTEFENKMNFCTICGNAMSLPTDRGFFFRILHPIRSMMPYVPYVKKLAKKLYSAAKLFLLRMKGKSHERM